MVEEGGDERENENRVYWCGTILEVEYIWDEAEGRIIKPRD